MLLNHENVQVGLLGEVVGLRARVKQLEQQLDTKQESKVSEQSLFKNNKMPAKPEQEQAYTGPVMRSKKAL